MSTAPSHDILILGGGAAGLAAARAARWEGATVALISDAPLGGDCTFTGCVPSKSLIEASRRGLDFEAGLAHVADVVATIAAGENAAVLRDTGVDVIEGRGRFVGPKTIEVAGRGHRGSHVIVATGSRPAIPEIGGIGDVPYRTNETFFEPRPLPDRMVVVGGGPIGCELGEAMARFGTKVTIIEMADRLLGAYEADASALVHEDMTRRGLDVRTSTRISAIGHDGTAFQVAIGQDVVEADEVLVASGRSPNTDGFGLDAAGIELDGRGFIATDRFLRTNVGGVYAVGDCNGKQMLSHAADEMGRLAVWTALRFGRRYAFEAGRIPHAVFTTPEVAAIGVIEADAPGDARVAEIEMAANDRALAAGEPAGFVRLIARPALVTRHRAGGKLIGATIVGGRAGELINEVALMMRMNAYPFRLAQTARAYPTWSTVMQKAATRFFYEFEGGSARSPRR